MIKNSQIEYLTNLLNERLKEFSLSVKVYKKNGHWNIDLYSEGKYMRTLDTQMDSHLAVHTLAFLGKFISSIKDIKEED